MSDLPENIEPEMESLPDAGGIIGPTPENINDLFFLADNIEKITAAQNRIRLGILKLAQPGDWMLFKKEGEDGKAEIGFAGANRIGSTIGVNYTNWEAKKDIGADEIGSWYRWEYECDASYRGLKVRVYGRAGSRDKFLGKKDGGFKPVHEVNEGDVKIIARRAALKEGVKTLFGLHHMDPNYLETNGIKLISAGGYTFKSKESVPGAPGKISAAQAKRLFAILIGAGKKPEQLQEYLKANYKIEKSEDVSWKDYEKICDWAGTK